MNSRHERLVWIDEAKGLAILLVVVGHVISNGVSSGMLTAVYSKNVHDIIYSFHMPLFFYLSGYFLYTGGNSDLDDIGQVTRKSWIRIVSLLIPYTLFSIIYWMTKFVMGGSGVVVHEVSQNNGIYEILYYPIGEYWFIYALIIYTSINFVLVSVRKKLGTSTYLHLLEIVCLLSLLCYLNIIDTNGLRILGGKRMLIYALFFFGAALFKHFDLSMVLLKDRFSILLLITLGIILLLIKFDQLSSPIFVLAFSVAVVFILGIVACMKQMNLKVFTGLGSTSMPIYLLHPYFVVLSKLMMGGMMNDLLYILLSSAISTVVPLFLYKFLVKRVRVLDFCFNPKSYLFK